MIDHLAARLFGRHVGRRPEDHAALRRGGAQRRCISGVRDRASHLGQPEVQDLGVAARADEDVCGLDIAVNDARAVRGIQRIGDLDAKGQHRVHLQPAMPGDCLLQRGAL